MLVRNSRRPLVGTIPINGAKNAILPIMAASVLCDSPVALFNVPNLTDVQSMLALLRNLGANVNFIYNKDCKANHTLEISCDNISNYIISREIAEKLRASFLMLGPMLSKFGKVKTAFPGGCSIGKRPVDMHIKALEKMGAKIEIDDFYVTATVKERLQGEEITFEKVSVGATENVIMAAIFAEGTTVIHNPAIEPEVLDLIKFLKEMGADINIEEGMIVIKGIEKLNGCSHKIIPDRIEAGTYSLAAIITGGELKLEGVSLQDIEYIKSELKTIGAEIKLAENGIIVSRKNDYIKPINVATGPYPGFPSDMQPQLMSVMCFADGVSIIEENVFENRFMHINELKKMGADINIEDNKATVVGVRKLRGADLYAKDLRSTAALILASLVAEGESMINNSDYLHRGYEAFNEKLNSCGADISLR
ncbi:MAG: UDP-N-acetylglucosamine 1-carboxyvinyltransferase [Wolbachia endosymbiont of Tyrophagus putrescentiae]|nr:UDP-N-acetylglucosamine 1-carboxyvinyltransferase [Wolbachia endosymbiont of Tyrophagus putrescentiae]